MTRHHILPALLGAVLFSAQAFAAPINYGDFPGASVMYTQVTEDANSAGDAPPLFGPPTITGDSMDFNPVGFSASSQNGGVDVTDGQLSFGIMANPGKAITNVAISEAGDTTLAGFGNDTTFSSVTTNLFVDILEVDGVPLSPTVSISTNLVFTPSGGTYGLGTDGGGGPVFNTGWSGTKVVDILAELASRNIAYQFGATKVAVNLDNTLTAISQNGTSALIAKKDADGVTIVTNFPEPASWTLALIALAAARLGRRSS
jgi:hypothetical protein